MMSLEQITPINPGARLSPNRVATALLDPPPVRRRVRLDIDGVPLQRTVSRKQVDCPTSRHRRPEPSLWRLIERMVGGWAPTLWQSILLVTSIISLLLVVVFAFGEIGVLFTIGLCVLAKRLLEHPLRA